MTSLLLLFHFDTNLLQKMVWRSGNETRKNNVYVGDIDISYTQVGSGPAVLFIGAAIARQLAQDGMHAVITALSVAIAST
ncbi:hypothetical protein [Pseudomonas benzenivorans]|uniref:Uncharacterized protein n=1 Tax=Pseudomonas benzenivorans TaxID=556533 RepID=A0ABY5H979_9PSED|nr:hypothetical protein [Pseudomonas benzenivorans]UTW08896.1 hypothetical protein KDW96_06175 [Pseudomonas benzenivorans]